MAKPEIQILVCLNERAPGASKPCCASRGALAVYHRFKNRIRELALKDRVMVVRTGCLKHCSQGTAVTIWPFNLWYGKVQVEDVEEILQTSVLGEGGEVSRRSMPDIPWE